MLCDDTGEVTITNDGILYIYIYIYIYIGATILKNLDVHHPAARTLVELATLQDKEVGDGTTSVVIIAAELLKRANELIKNKIHPTSVIQGYKTALKESIQFINRHQQLKVADLGKKAIVNAASTSMSSKLISAESELFSQMVVDAMQNVKVTTAHGDKYPIKAVQVIKVHGQSVRESKLVNGYVLEGARAAQGMPTVIKNPKIALIDFNLNKYRMQMGVNILIDDPEQLEAIRKKEMDITRERIDKIIKAGANLIISAKGIDDFALKYFIEAGCICLRRVNKSHLRNMAKASGASILISLSDLEGDEKFDPTWLGEADVVYEERIGDWDHIFIEGFKQVKTQTIVLRGANDFMVAEVERSVHDSLCVVKRVLESNIVIAGGGCVEAALSIYLDDFARTLGRREQLAIAEFAEALLVIPKTLAINAAQDAIELIAKLRVFHNASQSSDDEKKKDLRFSGLDLTNGKIRNNVKAGVLEPALSKIKCLK